MANTFTSHQALVNSSPVTIYTVPAATTAVVIGLRIGARLTQDVLVEANLDRAGIKTKIIGLDTPIPVGAALAGMQGEKLVLLAGDFIEISGSLDACADATLSVMEMT